MIETINKEQNSNSVIRWNPEFIIKKNDTTGNHIISFPVQHPQLLNFKHFKVLTKFDIKLDLDKVDRWGIYKYCDGSTTINQICSMIASRHTDVSESAIAERIKKLADMGLIVVM